MNRRTFMQKSGLLVSGLSLSPLIGSSYSSIYGATAPSNKVKVALSAKRKKQTPEGQVIEILKRANETFVGTLKVSKNYAFLLTESSTLANDIFIPKEKLKGGKNGEKAVVKITEWPEDSKNPFGQVIDILGKAGENTTEMHAILAEYGLPYSYPQAVEAAADKIPAEISPLSPLVRCAEGV